MADDSVDITLKAEDQGSPAANSLDSALGQLITSINSLNEHFEKTHTAAEKATGSLKDTKEVVEETKNEFSKFNEIGESLANTLGDIGRHGRTLSIAAEAAGVEALASTSKILAGLEAVKLIMEDALVPALAVGSALAALSIGAFVFHDASEAAGKWDQQMKILGQEIKNQGGDWGVLSKAVEEYADKQEKVGVFSREQVVEALKRATASGMSLHDAMILVSHAEDGAAATGRSLMDITTGLTQANHGRARSLTQLGIGTKDTIHDGMKLSEVYAQMDKQMGNANAAALDNQVGAWTRVHNTMDSVYEKIGQDLEPALSHLAVKMQEFVDYLDSHQDDINNFVTPLVNGFITFIEVTSTGLSNLGNVFNFLGSQQGKVLEIAAAMEALNLQFLVSGKLAEAAPIVWGALIEILNKVKLAYQAAFVAEEAFEGLTITSNILNMGIAWTVVTTAVEALGASLLALVGGPIGLTIIAATTIYEAWANNFLGIQDKVSDVMDAAKAKVDQFKTEWQSMTDIVKEADPWNYVENAINDFINNTLGMLDKLVTKIDEVLHRTHEAAKAKEQLSESIQPHDVMHVAGRIKTVNGKNEQESGYSVLPMPAPDKLDSDPTVGGPNQEAEAKRKAEELFRTKLANIELIAKQEEAAGQSHSKIAAEEAASLNDLAAKYAKYGTEKQEALSKAAEVEIREHHAVEADARKAEQASKKAAEEAKKAHEERVRLAEKHLELLAMEHKGDVNYIESEIEGLQRMLKTYNLTADERMNVTLKIQKLENEITADREKAEKAREKAIQDAIKNIEHLASTELYLGNVSRDNVEITISNQIDLLKKMGPAADEAVAHLVKLLATMRREDAENGTNGHPGIKQVEEALRAAEASVDADNLIKSSADRLKAQLVQNAIEVLQVELSKLDATVVANQEARQKIFDTIQNLTVQKDKLVDDSSKAELQEIDKAEKAYEAYANKATDHFIKFFEAGKKGAKSLSDEFKTAIKDMETALLKSYILKAFFGVGDGPNIKNALEQTFLGVSGDKVLQKPNSDTINADRDKQNLAAEKQMNASHIMHDSVIKFGNIIDNKNSQSTSTSYGLLGAMIGDNSASSVVSSLPSTSVMSTFIGEGAAQTSAASGKIVPGATPTDKSSQDQFVASGPTPTWVQDLGVIANKMGGSKGQSSGSSSSNPISSIMNLLSPGGSSSSDANTAAGLNDTSGSGGVYATDENGNLVGQTASAASKMPIAGKIGGAIAGLSMLAGGTSGSGGLEAGMGMAQTEASINPALAASPVGIGLDAAAFLYGTFHHKDNPALMPDKYGGPAFGQFQADLKGGSQIAGNSSYYQSAQMSIDNPSGSGGLGLIEETLAKYGTVDKAPLWLQPMFNQMTQMFGQSATGSGTATLHNGKEIISGASGLSGTYNWQDMNAAMQNFMTAFQGNDLSAQVWNVQRAYPGATSSQLMQAGRYDPSTGQYSNAGSVALNTPGSSYTNVPNVTVNVGGSIVGPGGIRSVAQELSVEMQRLSNGTSAGGSSNTRTVGSGDT